MTTKRHHIEVRGVQVEVVRKDIKNLHLGVYPPRGGCAWRRRCGLTTTRCGWPSSRDWGGSAGSRTALSAGPPVATRDDHRREPLRAGRRYRSTCIEHDGPGTVNLLSSKTLELRVHAGMGRDQREALLHRWYRQRLRLRIPQLIAQWEPEIGVTVAQWGIKRMKTRWGTCNVDARRIWLNLELAKKPASCLEYILVHEMVHLLERHHNERFRELMDRLMPLWREYREELNRCAAGPRIVELLNRKARFRLGGVDRLRQAE